MQGERASKKQQELLSFVDGFIKENGYGPSYREIMRGLGYKSVSTVATHIEGLITKGYLARRDNSARSLEVVTTRVGLDTETTLDDFEQTLMVKVKTLELTPEDKVAVSRVFSLLGYEKSAQAVSPVSEKNAHDTSQ